MDHLKIFDRLLVPKKTNLYFPSREIVIVLTSSVLFIPVHGNEHDAVVAITNTPYAIEFGDGDISELQSVDDATKLLLVTYNHELNQHCDNQKDMLEGSESDEPTKKCNSCVSDKLSGMRNCFPTEIWLKEKLIKFVAKWSIEEQSKKTTKQNNMVLPSSLSIIPKVINSCFD